MQYISKTFDGNTVEYIDRGEGDMLLFIPGWGVTPRAYEENIISLARSYRVIAPKLHKFGNLEKKIDILKRIIDEVVCGDVVLLGHSASGVLAVLFAAAFPQKIRGIVLVDSTGIVEGREKKEWVFYWTRHVVSLFKPSGNRPIKFLLFLAYDFLYEVFRHPKASLEQANTAIAINIIPYLEKLSMPVLILWGKEDDLTPVADSFLFLDALKHVELEVVPGSHDWLKLHPEVLKEKVDTFMKTIPI